METENKNISRAYGQVLLSWREPEHDEFELGPRSRIIVTALLALVIAWALYTNSPLMAITFILIGVVGYLFESAEPRVLDYFLTTRGFLAGDRFYPHEKIESFHIYEEEPFLDTLSLHTNGQFISHIHIPIKTVDQQELFDLLHQFVPEMPHDPNFIDSIEKMLHI